MVAQRALGRDSRGERDTRETLVGAANAYLDAFLEKKLDLVPWGEPCNRTEGGIRTGKEAPDDSCTVGVPAGVNIVGRRFIVDESIGAVVAFCNFGVGGLPDSHLFAWSMASCATCIR